MNPERNNPEMYPPQAKVKSPEEYQAFFAITSEAQEKTGSDIKVYESIQELRSQVESPEKWKATKEKAREELAQLPDTVLEQLKDRFTPFIEKLPRGHGKGHAERDFIHLATLLADPALQDKDPVELMVGVIAGAYHDVGNAVVERYEDHIRVAAHAEVGAYLFGEVAKDILPPHLMKLTQLAIAAHTHLQKERQVKRMVNGEEKTFTIPPYQSEVKGDDKLSLLLTREADKADTQGLPMLVRNFLIQGTEPSVNFDGTKFYKVEEDPVKNFEHQLTPEVRSKEYINEIIDPKQKTQTMVEHLLQFADSNVNITPYSKDDSEYFREVLVRPNAADVYQLVNKVTQMTVERKPEDIDKAVSTFLVLCDRFEPGSDTKELLPLIKKRFMSLSRNVQNHWYNAFMHAPEMHKQWYDRYKKRLESIDPQSSFTFKHDKMNTIARHVYALGREYLSHYAPVEEGK